MFNTLYNKVEWFLNKMGMGMRSKLITLFVFIKVAPLCLLAWLAWQQFEHLGDDLRERTEILAEDAKNALNAMGDIAVTDATKALDNLAQEDIERMTTDLAQQVASFLYGRDADISFAASLPPDAALYKNFLENKVGRLVVQRRWELDEQGKQWQPAEKSPVPIKVYSSNVENNLNFNYRPPVDLQYVERPLFLEMTFVDLTGQEKVKVVTTDRLSGECKDISRRENTYAKAETYFQHLKDLNFGDIYVSDVIGTYVPSRVIGIYNPENAKKAGIEFKPEEEAFAGKENPLGKRFKGIVRWATPVANKAGKIIGYVTLALDHDHIMRFMDHVTPSRKRYDELSDAYEGNYAFIWDYKGRSVVHPRHHSIVGFHPETGEPQIPWLEDRIYDRYKESGKDYVEFIEDEPIFVQQSTTKKPARELTRGGMVGLDCRYLNFAPQCTGWFDLTSQGGSGSFNILWSGLPKLTTAATIPYFTGPYAKSPRGFGFVAVGAGLEDFHRPATNMAQVLNKLTADTDTELKSAVAETKELISDNLADTAMSLSVSTILMSLLVVLIAVWMAHAFTNRITFVINGMSRFRRGERQFRFDVPIKDEMGILCDSFDSMAESIEKSAQGMLIITDRQRNVIYANVALLEAINKTLSDVLGRPYNEVTIFNRSNPLSCLDAGLEPEVEFHEPTNSWYKATAEEYRNEQGQLTGYIVGATDVTSMVEAQRKSEEQRALLDCIFSQSPDIMWYKNIQGQYLAVNPRFASLTGLNPEEIVGKSAHEIFKDGRSLETAIQDKIVQEQCRTLSTEEDLLFADGHKEIVESLRIPILDNFNQFSGILGVARDMTERTNIARALRQTQNELEKAVEQALEASAIKSQFLANMSHEIRTPMNAILGLSYLAMQEKMDEEHQSMLNKIHSAATGLLGIINDILDFSKIEARRMDLEMTPFSLSQEVCSANDIIRFKAMEKNIDFHMQLDPAVLELDFIAGDSVRLRQIIINLLGNAVKFTEKGGVVFEVECVEDDESKISFLFSVMDTGIGITKDTLDNLFKAFAQADGSITRRFGGTGLGLAISKELVELMGGQMQVESTPGYGSVFSFTLPFTRPEEATLTAAANTQAPVLQLDRLKGKNILLVEDNDINQLIAQSILEQADLVVAVANNGEEAVEAVRGQTFDLVLMDIQMPVMDGLQATKVIRESFTKEQLPIVAMTAHAMSDDHDKSIAVGMNDHITKPIDPDVLFGTLLKWIK